MKAALLKRTKELSKQMRRLNLIADRRRLNDEEIQECYRLFGIAEELNKSI